MKSFNVLLVCVVILQCSKAQSDSNTDNNEGRENSDLYNALCTKPAQVYLELDPNWVVETNMKSGWIFELGNNVSRLHLAETVKGEHLSDDFQDFDNLCTTTKYDDISQFHVNGTSYGYENKTAHWECHSTEELGKFDCEFSSDLTGYIDKVKYYPTYSDNKNYFVVVTCYAEGKVGWFAYSASYPLSEESKKDIKNHIKQLGFEDEVSQIYGPECI